MAAPAFFSSVPLSRKRAAYRFRTGFRAVITAEMLAWLDHAMAVNMSAFGHMLGAAFRLGHCKLLLSLIGGYLSRL
jgi:hypothetical protein